MDIFPQELEFTLSKDISDANFDTSDDSRSLTVEVEKSEIPGLPTAISKLRLLVKENEAKFSNLKEGDKIKVSGIEWNEIDENDGKINSLVEVNFDNETENYSILNIDEYYGDFIPEEGSSMSLTLTGYEVKPATQQLILAVNINTIIKDDRSQVEKIDGRDIRTINSLEITDFIFDENSWEDRNYRQVLEIALSQALTDEHHTNHDTLKFTGNPEEF